MGELLLWYVGLLWPDLVAVAAGILAIVITYEVILWVKEWMK